MLIHHIPNGYWTGASQVIDDRDGIPVGWVEGPVPPDVPEGKAAMWADGWVITDIPPAPAATVEELCAVVDATRDARIDGGFSFAGQRFQSRPSDRENIMGASQMALAAISQGAQPGDLRWADPDKDFAWITADNGLFAMDAQTTVGLFQAGVAFKSALTFYARALKDALLASDDPASIDIENGWPE